MTKHLSQVVANEKTTKNTVYGELTKFYHDLQKPDMFTGLQRTYQRNSEDGEELAPESKVVQMRVDARLASVGRRLNKLFEVTAQRDYTNTVAKADVVVDGNTLLQDAPVPYLLFLEKQLKDLRALVLKLPILDPTKVWSYDSNQRIHVAAPAVTSAKKKVTKVLTLAQATDKFPAQTQPYTDDVVVGEWTTIHQSGAISVAYRDDLLVRLELLTEAVKDAREEANRTAVLEPPVEASSIMDYLLNG